MALTFDDGPSRNTGHMLDVLAAYDAKATFYVLGVNVARNPAMVARMVAEGHQVGNHSWNHAIFPQLSNGAVINQIERTNAAIFNATGGYEVQTFRPPYGSFSARVAAVVPYVPVMWDIDTRDWEHPNANRIARLAGRARDGDIILMHDIQSRSVAAIPAIISKLREQGFTFVTVSELVAK